MIPAHGRTGSGARAVAPARAAFAARRGALAIAALALLPCAAWADPAAPVTRARALMGTIATVRIENGAGGTRDAALAARALDEMARVETVLTSWNPGSELQRLNRAAGAGPVTCSPDLFDAIRRSVALAEQTGGAFDPGVEALSDAWDLRGAGRVPSAEALAEALRRSGYTGLEIGRDGRTVRFAREGLGLDLGGIGKGFALDRAALALAGADGAPPRALLNLGGEILAIGAGEPWTIELAHPLERLAPVARLRVSNVAVSTSAQGERSLVVNGRRVGHVLDPRTGEPVDTRASVTVIAADATTADALSTALLVMGRERAFAFAREHPGIGLVWLEPSGSGLVGWSWRQEVHPVSGVAVRWMN